MFDVVVLWCFLLSFALKRAEAEDGWLFLVLIRFLMSFFASNSVFCCYVTVANNFNLKKAAV